MAPTPEPAPSPARPVELEDGAALDEFVETHDRALVEFYTAGCGICQSMEPVLGNVVRSTDVAVGTINPRDDPPLIEAYEITSVPTFVYFENSEPVDRRSDGFVGAEELVGWLDGDD